jgi:C4-dicarboxylate-specific signal transduction histidine kinase
MDALADCGQPGAQVRISVSHTENELMVAVRDNGPGVPAGILPRLFEPFYTSKPLGVGLGLSICKHIAAAHAGSLSHVPQAERGAQFMLKLPLSSIG